MKATAIRPSLATLFLLLLVGCSPPPPQEDPLAQAYPPDRCPSCAEWNTPQEPFRIFGNTYYVGTEGLASVLIASSEGHVLIDGGLPETAPLIAENIRALGLELTDVDVILNSHPHFDHAGGIAALRRDSGARVVALAPRAATIRRGNSGPEDPQHGALLDFPPVEDVEEISVGETITQGPLSLSPHSTPVHTPGGTTWTWRSCEGGECLDLVFADSQTPISAEGFRYSERPDLGAVEDGFVTLEALPCDILITPHPSASSFWERRASAGGLVDPEACRRYAASAREQLARRLASE